MRTLPADVYDALELTALAYDGIGQPDEFDSSGAPVCILGHAAFAGGDIYDSPLAESLRKAFAWIPGANSDEAVERINERRGKPPQERVPFSEWCKELDVVRGK